MTHTVHKCLLMPGEASSALHYTQTVGSHPTTWIIDTGAGVSMTWDRTKFKPETLVAFKADQHKLDPEHCARLPIGEFYLIYMFVFMARGKPLHCRLLKSPGLSPI